jgi:predicted aldo/keto reductase-like oxidoreductase
MTPSEGGALIREAIARGINLFDTAELYGTYPHVREGLRGVRDKVLVMTKSFAHTEELMNESIERARSEMSLDYIDIFLLHQQESEHTLRGHRGGLDALSRAREQGLVRAVGISTHHIAAVRAASVLPEIDVVFALLNVKGLGIQDGGAVEMEGALREAHAAGKGIVVMKALGGGHLFREAAEAISYLAGKPWVHSVCIGVRNTAELDVSLSLLTGGSVEEALLRSVQGPERRIFIESADCRGCGSCVETCGAGALRIEDGRAECDHGRCILCGYCAAACPDFCIKVL